MSTSRMIVFSGGYMLRRMCRECDQLHDHWLSMLGHQMPAVTIREAMRAYFEHRNGKANRYGVYINYCPECLGGK